MKKHILLQRDRVQKIETYRPIHGSLIYKRRQAINTLLVPEMFAF